MKELWIRKFAMSRALRSPAFLGIILVISLFAASSICIAEEKNQPLTNADVIRMLAAKIPESVVIAKIQVSEVAFDTTTDAIIELSKAGVSEKVLNTMLTPKVVPPGDTKATDKESSTSGTDSEAPESNVAVATGGNQRPSGLSYGVATGLVKKNVTTQVEIMELFGAPSVMTTDRDSAEVWMYDKTTTTVSGSAKQSGRQSNQSEASAMAAFFGIPLIAGVVGSRGSVKDRSEQQSESENTRTSSTTTFTFIIKFNKDKTVKDYSVRQAKF